MFQGKFTKAHEEILRAQVIDETNPGSILHDFQVVLNFVAETSPKAGGKYHMLPIEAIPLLDEHLHKPLRLNLKRPQLRSHPHLQGLHLLLRATGLVRVDATGEKAKLIIHPPSLAVWEQLNATERYFTLLEAWLLFGRPEMVGERMGSAGPLLSSFLFYHGWLESFMRGLADLFGFARFAWPVGDKVDKYQQVFQETQFGIAMGRLLMNWYKKHTIRALEVIGEGSFGVWQPLFQPYYPDWQKNFNVEEASTEQKGILVFKVSLGKVWRRIAMKHDHTLDDLVSAILRSVDFSSDHLYAFTYSDSRGRNVEATHPYCEDGTPANEVELGTLPVKPGELMKLVYDFGDNWEFKVKLEGVESAGKIKKLPKVIESHGKAPEQYPDWE